MGEIRRRYEKLSREYVTLVEELDHLSRDDSYHAEVLESLGDFINISAIMMAIAGQRVPFQRLTEKLFEKDKKFKTGKYKGS